MRVAVPYGPRAPTIVDAIRNQVEQATTRTVLRFLGDQDEHELALSYVELDRQARSVAAHLQIMGAGGERALLLHQPGPAYVAALLGCFYAGVIAVPAYPPRFNRSMERLRDLVLDAQARFALTTRVEHSRMQRHLKTEPALAALHWLATDEAIATDASDGWQPVSARADEVAVLQYTSGSTSAPKGVMLSHANLLYNMDMLVQHNGATADDVLVTWLPPYHDMGLIGALLAPLAHNVASVVLTPAAFLQRPLRWLAAISRHRATISGGPNFAYELCVRRINETQRKSLDLSTWRVAFSGAERVRAATLERFSNMFADCGFNRRAFAPCYGLAEATLAVSFSAPGQGAQLQTTDESQAPARNLTSDDAPHALVSCGRPLAGCEVQVIDPQSCEPVAAGAVGELWVRSPGVAQGYWNKPELSHQVFHARLKQAPQGPDYLRTGDLGFMRDGEVFVTGRIKDLIVLRGVNHYPEDIEATVEYSHMRLRLAAGAAFAVEMAGEERLVVVQEVEAGRDPPLVEMADAIRHAVAEAHELRIHELVLTPPGTVPRTSSGKIQRNRCRELFLAGELETVLRTTGDGDSSTADAPAKVIAQVQRLMAGLLGLDSMVADDDFFWLGGHSLLATQLASRVREVFGVELPLRVIFESATPRALATRIIAAPVVGRLPEIRPIKRGTTPLPLSFSQERMWFMHQLHPQDTAYNVAGAVRLEGPLDESALRLAFAEILKRHEVLRTLYREVDGAPQLHILEHASLALPVIDLSLQPDAKATVQQRATALASQPFDIANELLIRVELYRLGEQRHVLCASLHHLVTDAWSMGLLVADLRQFYELARTGQPMPAVTPALTYVDYAHWQRSWLNDALLQSELDFWREHLKGAEALELPTDRPRAQRQSSAGGLEPLELPAELMAALETFSTTQGATLFMVMLAAFEVLLHRYTHSRDLVIGVPVANRNLLASEPLMGTLVNTLPVRLQLDEDLTFTELLAQVRQISLDAYAHQNLPFEKLVSALGLERRVGESPLVRVMFDFQNTPMPEQRVGELVMSPLMLSRGAAQFDLSLFVFDTALGRIASVEYSSDLFDVHTIRRMLGHYRSLLESIVLEPHERISRIPLLDATERAALLAQAQANVHSATRPPPVHARVAEQAAATPLAIAVIDDEGSFTYQALQRRVNELAAALHALGVSKGSRVALYMERGRDLPAAMLAVLSLSAAYVPLDPRHPQDRIGYVLEDCEPDAVLTSLRLRNQLPASLQRKSLCIDALPIGTAPPQNSRHDETLAAYIIYTSGSTGRPKGVEVSRHALANFVRSIRHTPGMTSADRLLSVTTVAFDIAGLELFVPLCAGASVYVASSEAAGDGLMLLDLMQRWRPTLLQATPATWKMLLESGWQGEPELKILCGGEALPPELAQTLLPLCASLWNMYGPTETTIWSTLHQVRSEDSTLVPIGTPLDATAIYILDAHQQPVPTGVTGEIYIGGDGVANGYFRRAELTAERFLPDPFRAPPARMYRTGDAGRLNSRGLLEHLGRLDTQIKIRGFRIEPGEIEIVIKDNPAVRDAVVIAREDRPGDMRLVAYYVPIATASAETGLPTAELLEPLRRKLPAYMIPATFVSLAALPLTPNGKVDRKALPKPESALDSLSEEYVAPRDEIEAVLVQLWQELLNIERVGVRDHFFMLGGHSLLAVRCFARIRQRFGVVLSMSTLFERPTIEYLAERIRTANPARTTTTAHAEPPQDAKHDFEFIVPIQTKGNSVPLFCVHGAGGNVMNFWPIMHLLGQDQPFFGLQARGVDGVAMPHTDIITMAADYLAELRQVQPVGPYYLSGYCAGGWIAFEMARQLKAVGEEVAMLALLDCYYPTLPMPMPTWRDRLHSLRTEGIDYVWRKLSERVQRDWTHIFYTWKITRYLALRQPIPYELRDFWLTDALLQAAQRYEPHHYDGTLLLLRARDVEPQLSRVCNHLGWQGRASRIEVVDVPGNHHTLAQEPHVVTLVAVLKERLARGRR